MITENTKVPLKLTAVCITAFVSGALWISSWMHKVDVRLMRIETVLKIAASTGGPSSAAVSPTVYDMSSLDP